MGGGDAATAATPPAGSGGPPSAVGRSGTVERLKERLQEAARRREELMERRRDAISRLRSLHLELDEAMDADGGDPATTSDVAVGREDVNVKEELKRLQIQVNRQLEVRARALGGKDRWRTGAEWTCGCFQVELAAVEGLDAGEAGEHVAVVEGGAEETAVGGKRKRGEGREEGNASSAPRGTSEVVPLQRTDLMCEAS